MGGLLHEISTDELLGVSKPYNHKFTLYWHGSYPPLIITDFFAAVSGFTLGNMVSTRMLGTLSRPVNKLILDN